MGNLFLVLIASLSCIASAAECRLDQPVRVDMKATKRQLYHKVKVDRLPSGLEYQEEYHNGDLSLRLSPIMEGDYWTPTPIGAWGVSISKNDDALGFGFSELYVGGADITGREVTDAKGTLYETVLINNSSTGAKTTLRMRVKDGLIESMLLGVPGKGRKVSWVCVQSMK